jgi:hypothetical protein
VDLKIDAVDDLYVLRLFTRVDFYKVFDDDFGHKNEGGESSLHRKDDGDALERLFGG